MSVIADLIRAGVDPDLVARVADEITAAAVAASSAKRSKHAEAQARYHAKKQAEKVEAAITSDQNDQTDQASEGEKEKAPQTPKKENPPSKENPPKGGQKKGSPLSLDWQPRPEDWAQAVALLGEHRAKTELTKFGNYWPGVPGEKGRKLDWNGTWRNWVLKAAEYARGSPGKTRGASLVDLAFPELRGYDDQPSDQPHTGQSSRPANPSGSGFAGALPERGGGDNGGALLDLRPTRAGW